MAEGDLKDFFVSFNKADRAWAEWIAWILEEAGYSVLFQHWDFKGNFVLEMDRAHKETRRTIAVLSPDYLTSAFTAPEWAARFSDDARSEHDLLIPVRVRECELSGLLAQIIYVDLIGTHRSDARQRLLDRVAGIRLKPSEEPFFPGGPLPQTPRTIPSEPRFPVAVNNLPPINPDFVGREDVLAELRRLLTASQGPAVLTQAITGLGGIGKTQTARAYAYRHLADYELIWWLRAETMATLSADFAALAGPLGFDPNTADQPKLIAAIRRRLQSRYGWLLILDNVEDPALPRNWLPGTGGGHVLITSRRTDWRGLARELSLELMPEAEALELLTGRSDPQALPRAEVTGAHDLAAELGHLPLALAQARAYMAETGKGPAAYLRLFRDSRPAEFADDTPGADYPASFATTWRLSIEAAQAACPGAVPLLEALAYLAPEPLPVEVLGTDPETLPVELRRERERDEGVAALRRYSLIRVEDSAITVHRLVQAVTRDGLDATTKRTRAGAAIQMISRAIPRPPQEPWNWRLIERLLPHIESAAYWAIVLQNGLELAASAINDAALYQHGRGNWSEAEHLYIQAISVWQRYSEHIDANFGVLLNNLGNLYFAIGDNSKAEPLYVRAIAIGTATVGADNPDVAVWMSNLGNVYRQTGRYDEAESLLLRAIATTEGRLGAEHPNLSSQLGNLADLYQSMGRVDQAEELFRRAIAIGESAQSTNRSGLALRLINLAGLYMSSQRFMDAEPIIQRAIAIDYLSTTLRRVDGYGEPARVNKEGT